MKDLETHERQRPMRKLIRSISGKPWESSEWEHFDRKKIILKDFVIYQKHWIICGNKKHWIILKNNIIFNHMPKKTEFPWKCPKKHCKGTAANQW